MVPEDIIGGEARLEGVLGFRVGELFGKLVAKNNGRGNLEVLGEAVNSPGVGFEVVEPREGETRESVGEYIGPFFPWSASSTK